MSIQGEIERLINDEIIAQGLVCQLEVESTLEKELGLVRVKLEDDIETASQDSQMELYNERDALGERIDKIRTEIQNDFIIEGKGNQSVSDELKKEIDIKDMAHLEVNKLLVARIKTIKKQRGLLWYEAIIILAIVQRFFIGVTHWIL